MPASARPATLGALKSALARGDYARRSVRDEVRDNLILKLRRGDRLFPGVVGYDDTVIPQLVNAILAKHHFILLGLRGQAKTRLIRALVDLLDDAIPVVPGSEIHDDPLAPISAHGRAVVAAEGDDMPLEWRPREARYVEKLATPDVTIADLIGDIDPIKAAASGLQLGSELAMHFGLLPRANRGLFAINELPDLAGKVQVGLFNILQEGDVQIEASPCACRSMSCSSSRPTPRTTPRAARSSRRSKIASAPRSAPTTWSRAPTRWPSRRRRPGSSVASRSTCRPTCAKWSRKSRSRRAPIAGSTGDRASVSACRSARSRRWCRTRNAARSVAGEGLVVPRVTDAYAALPSITGKIELEYEGELKGAHAIARELIRGAVAQVFDGYFVDADVSATVNWFDNGGSVLLGDGLPASSLVVEASKVPGLMELAGKAALPPGAPAPLVAAAVDFVLEGLYSQKRIGRSDAGGYVGTEPVRRPQPAVRHAPAISLDEDDEPGGPPKKKRYYN